MCLKWKHMTAGGLRKRQMQNRDYSDSKCFLLCRLDFMHHPQCAHSCVAFANCSLSKARSLLLVISWNVFLFSSPSSHSPPLCFPCWNGLQHGAPLTKVFCGCLQPLSPAAGYARALLVGRAPSPRFRLIFVDYVSATYLEMEIEVSLTRSCLDGYFLMNASAPIGSQASTMNVQKRHCPSYVVYQTEHRFTFQVAISSICNPIKVNLISMPERPPCQITNSPPQTRYQNAFCCGMTNLSNWTFERDFSSSN